jgi:hypothetical protein
MGLKLGSNAISAKRPHGFVTNTPTTDKLLNGAGCGPPQADAIPDALRGFVNTYKGGIMYNDGDTRMAFRISREQFLGKVNARIAEIDAALTDKVRQAKVALEYQKQLKAAADSVDKNLKDIIARGKKAKAAFKKLSAIKQPTYDQLQEFGGYCSKTNYAVLFDHLHSDYLSAYCQWVRQMERDLAQLRQLRATLEMATDDKISIRNHSMQEMMEFLSQPIVLPEIDKSVQVNRL